MLNTASNHGHTSPMSTSTPASAQSTMLQILSNVLFYVFGLFNWLFFVVRIAKSGDFFATPSEQEQLRLAISRDRFWNLSKQPIKGFEHAFFKIRNGKKLHYITNRKSGSAMTKNGGNLFIFLHGFPDSSMGWRYTLEEPGIPKDNARLVFLDLPNYGGSDHFDVPDTAVLEAVSEFVVAMKEEHEEAASSNNKNFNTIIVAHDWGCVIGFRLAAEAPALADRFILTNGPHIGLSLANKDRIIHSSLKIFKQFQESPKKNFGCLKKSFKALRPLLRQTVMFGYIFAFHLPRPMVKYLGHVGNYSLSRAIVKMSHGKNRKESDVQEGLAAMLGPGVIEVDTKTADGESYGSTVHLRANSAGEPFCQQTAYYRNGLAFQKWEKSLELIADLYNLESESSASAGVSPIRRRSSSSASSTLFTEQYVGALRAPCTILWGEKDTAVGKQICLDGIGDYLSRGSEVILLPRTAHWTPIEEEGRCALTTILQLCGVAVGDNMPVYMTKEVGQVYRDAVSMVRK